MKKNPTLAEQRLEAVENSVITLNREMGSVLAHLVWIRWAVMGILGAIVFGVVAGTVALVVK